MNTLFMLLEWIKQHKFIDMTPNKKYKSRLERGGRLPSTLGIEENLIK